MAAAGRIGGRRPQSFLVIQIAGAAVAETMLLAKLCVPALIQQADLQQPITVPQGLRVQYVDG